MTVLTAWCNLTVFVRLWHDHPACRSRNVRYQDGLYLRPSVSLSVALLLFPPPDLGPQRSSGCQRGLPGGAVGRRAT